MIWRSSVTPASSSRLVRSSIIRSGRCGIIKRGGADLDGEDALGDQRLERVVRPVAIPPMPMIGSPGNARATSQTIRNATGLMAGPERPPTS